MRVFGIIDVQLGPVDEDGDIEVRMLAVESRQPLAAGYLDVLDALDLYERLGHVLAKAGYLE